MDDAPCTVAKRGHPTLLHNVEYEACYPKSKRSRIALRGCSTAFHPIHFGRRSRRMLISKRDKTLEQHGWNYVLDQQRADPKRTKR